jgi:hypothetical protein
MAARAPDSGIFMPEEYFFPSTQHGTLDMMAHIYMTHASRGCGPSPVSQEQFNKNYSGGHIYEAGKFGLMRTNRSIASFSWGRRVMGMVFPLQNDLLWSPYELSMVGSVQVKGVKREYPRVKQVKVDHGNWHFSVAGVLDRGDGAAEQRFAFVALNDGRVVYIDSVRLTTTTKVSQLNLGTVAVVNEERWPYHDGKRVLYHAGGDATFDWKKQVSEPLRLKSKWYNIDDSLGILCMKSTGEAEYVPNWQPTRGRVEQLFHLNAVNPGEAEPGTIIAETVLVFYPGQKHEDTSKIAEKVELTVAKDGVYTLAHSTETITADLNKLKIVQSLWNMQ